MPFTTLLSPADLKAHLNDPDWVIIDCRFSLNDAERGRSAYREAHIPGAQYAHLDDDLSSPIVPGITGRHPLPEPDTFAQTVSAWGIDEQVQVVAYDDQGGGVAARLWWMLRWLGHYAVAVLDGGWPAWLAAEYPTRSGTETGTPRSFQPKVNTDWVVDAATVDVLRLNPSYRLIDARAEARYRGEEEPIDPVAGHIPGAHSVPFAGNLDANGKFQLPAVLRARFQSVLQGTTLEQVICYCGSGVTAAHNLLALQHAGLGCGRLYAGSWSDWINDPQRPIEVS